MIATTANGVADYFINFAHQHGDNLTNLKLQKLAYYAQAWHLALHDDELFPEEFEAWVHGPVCVPLYHRFRDLRWNPIMEDPGAPALDAGTASHLEEVFGVFGRYSAYDLEQMTHAEEPWVDARGGIPLDEPSRNIIPKPAMKEYYSNLADSED